MSESNEFMLGQGQGHQLEMAIRRNGGTTTDVQYLIEGDHFNAVKFLARGEAELILKPKPPAKEEIPESEVKIWKLIGETNTQKQEGFFTPTSEYKFQVDYDLSFEQLMERANCEISTYHTENMDRSTFPNLQGGKRELSFELVKFPKWGVYTEDVDEQFANLKLRHANLVEQLSFVAHLAKIHVAYKSQAIIAIGSRTTVCETIKEETTTWRWFRKLRKSLNVEFWNGYCPSVGCGGTYKGTINRARINLSHCKGLHQGWQNWVIFLGVHIE